MSISNQDKKRFRSIGHQLKPAVTISARGVVSSVLSELERALNDHELVKIKCMAEDRIEKEAMIKDVVEKTGAAKIQSIGNICLLYRPVKEPNPRLSNLIRFSHS